MSALASRWLHLPLALAVGAGAAAFAVSGLDERGARTPPPPGDRVTAIVEGLREDPVHVTPDARAWLSEDAEEDVVALIEERDLPVRVVVAQASTNAGYDHPSLSLEEQVLAGLDEPTLLVLWQGDAPSSSGISASDGWRVRSKDFDESWESGGPTFLGDAATDLEQWLTPLPDDVLVESTPSDYYGGIGGAVAYAALVGGLVVGGVWVVLGIVRVRTGRSFLLRG